MVRLRNRTVILRSFVRRLSLSDRASDDRSSAGIAQPPDPDFDAGYYRRSNPDIALAGSSPWAHYVTRGRSEHREPHAAAMVLSKAELPTDAEWAALPTPPAGPEPQIDIVIPVYAGRAETLRTLHRVLSAPNRSPFRVVVVDDASPDAGIVERVASLAQSGYVDLISNTMNCGFVVSVNRGLNLHPHRDVILLNADTEVFGDWVDRLSRTASRSPSTGTVTPWSSDATILSYPIRLRPNRGALETSDEALDRIAAELPPTSLPLPTAVGFCMLIKRACLDQVGPFDDQRFGHGYGEENDFCRRAARRGWWHAAAVDVYVRHHGGRSFGAEKTARVEAAQATLARLYPGYRRLIMRFNAADSLRASRQSFDEARIRAAMPGHVLTDSTQVHAPALAGYGALQAVAALRGRPGDLDLRSQPVPVTPNLPILTARLSPSASAERLAALAVRAVEITGADPTIARRLSELSHTCGLPLYRTT